MGIRRRAAVEGSGPSTRRARNGAKKRDPSARHAPIARRPVDLEPPRLQRPSQHLNQRGQGGQGVEVGDDGVDLAVLACDQIVFEPDQPKVARKARGELGPFDLQPFCSESALAWRATSVRRKRTSTSRTTPRTSTSIAWRSSTNCISCRSAVDGTERSACLRPAASRQKPSCPRSNHPREPRGTSGYRLGACAASWAHLTAPQVDVKSGARPWLDGANAPWSR